MKVGDYVKNKYGIAKIIDISNNNGIDIIEFDRDIAFLVNKETKKEHSKTRFLPLTNNVDINKLKTSPRIIDLIEVGDYVNGIRIEEKYKNVDGNWVVGEDCGDSYYDAKFENEDIKSIVTKEMFSNISYKVGE